MGRFLSCDIERISPVTFAVGACGATPHVNLFSIPRLHSHNDATHKVVVLMHKELCNVLKVVVNAIQSSVN